MRTLLLINYKLKIGTTNKYYYFLSHYRQPKPYVSTKEPFVPAGPSKKHACPGDYFGTFAGKISAFGRKLRPQPPYKPQNPNPVTSPGKKGGPGYVGITLSKYPTHL